MIEHLRREMAQVDALSPEEQEELALFIAVLRETHAAVAHGEMSGQGDASLVWHDPAGAWSDLPEDDEAAAFARLRHETPASPLIEP